MTATIVRRARAWDMPAELPHTLDFDPRSFFRLDPAFLATYEGRQPLWGPIGPDGRTASPIGLVTFLRTYPAYDHEKGRLETPAEVFTRCVEAVMGTHKRRVLLHDGHWSDEKAQREGQELFRRMWALKVLPGGRSLANLGRRSLLVKGAVQLNNCSFVSTQGIGEDFARPFCTAMDYLMLGSGVGFDVRGAAANLPILAPVEVDEHVVIPDTREGWVMAVARVFRAFRHEDTLPVRWDFSAIRRKGEPLRTFGGVSSGPAPLRELLATLTAILARRVGTTFRSADIVDGMNVIGRCVVAGGVRRSSEIALGDAGDTDFLALKDPAGERELMAAQLRREASMASIATIDATIAHVRTRQEGLSVLSSEWGALQDQIDAAAKERSALLYADPVWADLDTQLNATPTRAWRWASNNSVIASVGDDYTEIGRRIGANGEPGVLWLDNVRRFGRMRDGDLTQPRLAGDDFIPGLRPDLAALGSNPCQPAEALVLTPDGIRTMADLVVGSTVWSGSRWTRVVRKVATGVKPVFRYRTTAGAFLGTADHRVVQRGVKVAAGEADAIDRALGPVPEATPLDPADVLDGLLVGDGGWHGASGINFLHEGAKDAYRGTEVDGLLVDRSTYGEKTVWRTKSTLPPLPRTYELAIPAKYLHGNTRAVRGFLRGLYSANGSIVGGARITLKAASRAVIDGAQAMLSSIGIGSYVTTNAAHDATFANGTYTVRESYDLNIATREGRELFARLVGFIHPEKEARLAATLSPDAPASGRGPKVTFDIATVEALGEMPVFDITVEADEHTYWTAGLLVSNCGEIALEDHELCNLVETFPTRHDSVQDWVDSLKYAYLIAKAVSDLPSHNETTGEVIARNRRLGISITGIAGWYTRLGRDTMCAALDRGYRHLRALDRLYSGFLGVPESIRLTTTKPSGCRPWNALTSTSGGILTLEELLARHPDGQDWAPAPEGLRALQGPEASSRITKTYVNGTKPVYRVTLSYGLHLESTGNHPWFVAEREDRTKTPRRFPVGEWVPTEKLTPGDILEVRLGAYDVETHAPLVPVSALAVKMRGDAEIVRQPTEMSPDLAWFLGYLWGDGAMSPARYRIRFVDGRREHLERAQRIARELFGLEGEIRALPDRDASELTLASKHLWHWLIRNDVWKYHAEKIDLIPRVVRASSREDILAFLAGLLDADGSAVFAPSGGKLLWTTADAAFASHVQHVAWAVGLGVGWSTATKGTSSQAQRECHFLTVGLHYDRGAFARLVAHSTKAQGLTADPRFTGWHGWEESADGERRGLIPGKVLKVEPIGEMPTYDVEVEATHWFYAGAVRSHNTLSLLAGVEGGMRFPEAKHLIRIIRIHDTSPLVDRLERSGYRVEPDRYAPNTVCVYFPHMDRDVGRSVTDVTVWEQARLQADIQTHWADNMVSATWSFTKAEAPHLAQVLATYERTLKGATAYPHSPGAFVQPPYQPVSEAEYDALAARCRPLDLTNLGFARDQEERFCDGGVCELPARKTAE